MVYSDSSDFEDLDDADETSSLDFLHNVEVSESAQNRVLSVDPNEGHCLVENCPDPLLVDFCHCYPRKLMSDDSLNRNDFEYTFIPVSNTMKEIAVHRQDRIPPPGVAITREDVTTHVYPFDTLPILKSHLSPKFVILEAGRKLSLLNTASNLEITTRYPILLKVTQIVQAWTSPRPSDAMNNPSYHSVRVDENGFVSNYLSNDENSDGYDSRSDVETQPIRFGLRKRLSANGTYRRASPDLTVNGTPNKRSRVV
ncbi:hypothetical protein Clacol_005808 [Clathrus columnatus]|uniref:Uncharacterized protein n=1 Tax=Clathrus columnatus TaxID=1419009 RepID=A0AAV5AEM2_9AGAM|nr:hypothetical protein Clacol_005808 [Clathrus columnatus]